MYLITLAQRILNCPLKIFEWITGRKRINYNCIVEQIVKDYLFKNEKNLKHEKGKIVQSHISRGLHGSTGCVGEQFEVHFRLLDNLVDNVIRELEGKFSSIPLIAFKDSLLSVIDREYEKLIRIVPGLLHQSQLLQSNLTKDFENGILLKKQKGRQKVENLCAIYEDSRTIARSNRERWYQNRTIQAALVGAVIGVVLNSIIIWLVRKF